MIGRRVAVPWQLGDYVVPAGQGRSISILLVHHVRTSTPDPFTTVPSAGSAQPGTYEWLPFCRRATRRCLGGAGDGPKQRVVLEAMVARLDLGPRPDRAEHRPAPQASR